MDILVYLIGLSAMEIVLGIDNIVFLSIVTGRLPAKQQPLARQLGLGLALVMRIGLLFMLSWIMSLDKPVFYLHDLGSRKACSIPVGPRRATSRPTRRGTGLTTEFHGKISSCWWVDCS